MDSVTRCPVSRAEEHTCDTCKYWETTTVEIDIQPMNEHMIIHSEPCYSCWRGNLVKDRDRYEDKWEPRPRTQTALEIIEEVKADVCDKICKYREHDTQLDGYCDGCPLERLA